MNTKTTYRFLARMTTATTILLATLMTQGAFAAPIPQNEMDQLHNFFAGTLTAANGILIAINQPPAVLTPEAQKMAQMISSCQIQKQNPSKYTAIVIIGGNGCPIGYTKVVNTRPEADGSVLVSTTERDVLNSDAARILTGLSQYSISSAMTTVTQPSGAYTASGNSQKRYVSADGASAVTVQVNSALAGSGLAVTSDQESFTISFGAKTYTTSIAITNGNSVCTINGASATCATFNYIMGIAN